MNELNGRERPPNQDCSALPWRRYRRIAADGCPVVFGAPEFLGSKIVRAGLLADPHILVDASEALRDAQYAPVLDTNRAAIETPFASSWKGSPKPEVTLVEFFDYACPYCKASNPAVDQLLARTRACAWSIASSRSSGRTASTPPGSRSPRRRLGRFAQFHDTLWATGRPAADTNAKAAAAAGIPPQPVADPAIEAELKRQHELAGQLGATGTPLFVVGDRVMNGAVGYDGSRTPSRRRGPRKPS